MVELLPAARLYARVPVSNFRVGAVVKARLSAGSDEFALFTGANIEFAGQALTQTIHAEQAAVVNAWLQGAVRIDAIAVSASPCGRCRQFLYELDTGRSLTVIGQTPDGDGYTTQQLSDLLPQAFGPQNLSVKTGFISSRRDSPQLNLKTGFDDPLVLEALSAAEGSYAPYTHNFAGCTIQVSDQKIFAGSYVETAPAHSNHPHEYGRSGDGRQHHPGDSGGKADNNQPAGCQRTAPGFIGTGHSPRVLRNSVSRPSIRE